MRIFPAPREGMLGFHCIVCQAAYIDVDICKKYGTSVGFECFNCGTKLRVYRINQDYKVVRED